MTTLDSSKEIQKNNSEVNETHEDFRMFGLITFLIADGMTFAGFFAAYLTYKAVKDNHFWDSEFLSFKSALPALWKVALLTSNKIVLSVGIGSSNS